jgi:hypothetical protein
MNRDAYPAGAVHDLDVLLVEGGVEQNALWMLEGNNTAGVGRIEARHRGEAEFGDATMNRSDEWIRVSGNFRHTDGVNVLAGRVQCVNSGEIGHPDGETGGASFGNDSLEPIRLECVREMKPSTGMESRDL